MITESKFYDYEREHFAGALEAILFACGTPVEKEKLCEILEINPDELEVTITALKLRMGKYPGGFELLSLEDTVTLCTRIEYKDYVSKALEVKRNVSLSKPSLEVLAIIAYTQPVTKAYIEKIRGVDCSGIVNTLLEKELIEERGRMDAPGRPILYGTTLNFLKSFGLSSVDDLPDIDKYGDAQISLDID
ncbi:MAG: SMC-Scp complex subunit ScpB [Clostridia bacterium]|nr:SMC-Scp complex subunit ScpB [Clostridia bacterium]